MSNVLDGATLLSQHCPTWKSRINIEKLNMQSCSECVLGQCFGDYDTGIVSLDISEYEAAEFGFDMHYDTCVHKTATEISAMYNELGNRWKAVIR